MGQVEQRSAQTQEEENARWGISTWVIACGELQKVVEQRRKGLRPQHLEVKVQEGRWRQEQKPGYQLCLLSGHLTPRPGSTAGPSDSQPYYCSAIVFETYSHKPPTSLPTWTASCAKYRVSSMKEQGAASRRNKARQHPFKSSPAQEEPSFRGQAALSKGTRPQPPTTRERSPSRGLRQEDQNQQSEN